MYHFSFHMRDFLSAPSSFPRVQGSLDVKNGRGYRLSWRKISEYISRPRDPKFRLSIFSPYSHSVVISVNWYKRTRKRNHHACACLPSLDIYKCLTWTFSVEKHAPGSILYEMESHSDLSSPIAGRRFSRVTYQCLRQHCWVGSTYRMGLPRPHFCKPWPRPQSSQIPPHIKRLLRSSSLWPSRDPEWPPRLFRDPTNEKAPLRVDTRALLTLPVGRVTRPAGSQGIRNDAP